MQNDIIFQPLKFRNLTVKNRLFRSSISGRWDNYDGSGNQARIGPRRAVAGAALLVASEKPRYCAPLGGCKIGRSREEEVVDHWGAVFGYENL